MEHITTKEAVDFVLAAPDNVGATITCHHLLYNRTALFQGGLRPHMYCLPVLKRETHRQALTAAVQSGTGVFVAMPWSTCNNASCYVQGIPNSFLVLTAPLTSREQKSQVVVARVFTQATLRSSSTLKCLITRAACHYSMLSHRRSVFIPSFSLIIFCLLCSHIHG
jgi:hypothetical protein